MDHFSAGSDGELPGERRPTCRVLRRFGTRSAGIMRSPRIRAGWDLAGGPPATDRLRHLPASCAQSSDRLAIAGRVEGRRRLWRSPPTPGGLADSNTGAAWGAQAQEISMLSTCALIEARTSRRIASRSIRALARSALHCALRLRLPWPRGRRRRRRRARWPSAATA